jgi:alpha-glucosidase
LVGAFAACPQIPYEVVNYEETNHSITALLGYTGTDDYYIKTTSPWVKLLNFTCVYEGETEFQITITDAHADRFRLPYRAPFPYTKKLDPIVHRRYKVEVTFRPFAFRVIRNSTNEIIFDTKNFDFVYSDLAIQIGTDLPSRYLYGLGERRAEFLLKPGTYTIYNRDHYNSTIDDGQPGKQIYGAHPVYLMREKSNMWHSVLFRNINAMDFVWTDNNQLMFKTIGGIIEFKFFLGCEYPDSAVKQYHRYANGVALTPFWSHGWHQSRWGIKDYDMFKTVIDNYTNYSLPLDTIWSDIDYLDDFKDFTISDKFQPERLKALLKSKPGLHWIPILDPGIAIGDNPAYYDGLKRDIFIKSPTTGGPLVGRLWPGDVHFPDFSNPKTLHYWADFCQYLYDQVPFSGIWTDENEFASFCNGECNVTDPKGLTSKDFPYVPNNGSLEDMTLPLSAVHAAGFIEKDVHSVNGLMQTLASRNFFKKIGVKLPFILSRSTAIGSGAITQHWTGDNWSSYDYMKLSIGTLFSNQIFGNVMCGDDVCGFNGDADELICSYWMQLGVLYPFARSHNSNTSADQMPFQMGSTLLETSRASLQFRYSILKWYYSIFVRNAGAVTIFRPMFFEYPGDDDLLGLETQFMIGHELLSAPCFENTTDCAVDVYFPSKKKFFDFKTGKSIHDYSESSKNVTIKVPLNDSAPIFIRAGSIVYKQDASMVNSTKFLDNNFELVVALEQIDAVTYKARGKMLGIKDYSDEKLVVENCTGDRNCLVDVIVTAQFTLLTEGLQVNVTFVPHDEKTSDFQENFINKITFYGVKAKPCYVGDKSCDTDYTIVKNYNKFLVAPNATIIDSLSVFTRTE